MASASKAGIQLLGMMVKEKRRAVYLPTLSMVVSTRGLQIMDHWYILDITDEPRAVQNGLAKIALGVKYLSMAFRWTLA